MIRFMIHCLIVFIIVSKRVSSLNDIKNCRNALGMQSGHILDAQLSSSSSFNEITLGPASSRIRTERNGGAWCPKHQITSNVYEYLQINLNSLHVITMIETQGRFGNGQGIELTEQYRIEYSRDRIIHANHTKWIRYKDRENNQVLKGNENTYSAELRELSRPIIARYIRIIPVSKLKRTVCLRVELYGCQFKDDIVSYETRDGDLRSSNSGQISFKDKIYDGIQTSNGYLRGGLGLLTDGELGDDSFRNERYGVKGYEWFGWRNDTHEHIQEDGQNVEEAAPHKILFKFDNIRNFSLCTLYINNAPSQRIELYRLIRFKFSLNGLDFGSEVESTLNRDLNMNMARPILVPLKFIAAKYVLVEIYFHSKWLLISEITFDSEFVDVNIYNSIESNSNNNQVITLEQEQHKLVQISNIYYLKENSSRSSSPIVTNAASVSNSSGMLFTNHLTLQTLIMILITLLAFLVVVFIFIIVCFMKKRKSLNRKYQQQQQQQQQHNQSRTNKKKKCLNLCKIRELFGCKTSTSAAKSSTDSAFLNGLITSSTTSTNAAAVLAAASQPTICLNQNLIASLQQQQQHQQTGALFTHYPQFNICSNNNNLDTMKSTKYLTSFENSLESTYLYPSLKYKAAINQNENSDVLKALLNHQQQQHRYIKLLENNNNIHYATTDISSSSNATSTTTTGGSTSNSKMIKLIQSQPVQYNASNTNLYYTIKPQSTTLARFSSNNSSNRFTYQQQQQQQQQQPQQIEFVSMRKIDANLLCFLDKIGESTVSNFYVGKMNLKSLSSTINDIDSSSSGTSTTSSEDNNESNIDVLIKVLKTEQDPVIKFGFDNDIDLTTINKLKIDNLNLIKLIGFCDNPYCYIIDYYSNSSNLYEYMSTPNLTQIKNLNKDTNLLMKICSQIANAMLYLESLNHIHKDLSCKNCIININNNEISIKVCDLSRYMYSYRNDYCILLTNTQQSIRLRHTAWETICTGQFTSKSDVWSFGLIIFELLTSCKQLAYEELSDEQLIQLVNSTYQQQQQQQYCHQQQISLNYLVKEYLIKQSSIDEFKSSGNSKLVDLMFDCLNLNVFDRPNFNDINLLS